MGRNAIPPFRASVPRDRKGSKESQSAPVSCSDLAQLHTIDQRLAGADITDDHELIVRQDQFRDPPSDLTVFSGNHLLLTLGFRRWQTWRWSEWFKLAKAGDLFNNLRREPVVDLGNNGRLRFSLEFSVAALVDRRGSPATDIVAFHQSDTGTADSSQDDSVSAEQQDLVDSRFLRIGWREAVRDYACHIWIGHPVVVTGDDISVGIMKFNRRIGERVAHLVSGEGRPDPRTITSE